MKSDAAITGVALSEVGRRLRRAPVELTVEAAGRAIGDAGLEPGDVDGISLWNNGVSVSWVSHALGLNARWSCTAQQPLGQIGAIMGAVAAIATRQAEHVLCCGAMQRTDAALPISQAATVAARHFRDYGTTREQLGQIAVSTRANAAKTSYGVVKTPLTLDDYLAEPALATPLCEYDCDIPVDGGAAVVVSRACTARQLRHDPLSIESIGTGGSPQSCAAGLWARSHFTVDDVRVAELYDQFSIFALIWLESLGFCGRGESGAFVEGGKRIGVDGELPLNTGGGQLAGGRLLGNGLLYQACLQLWGQARATQVAGDPRVAVVAVGGARAGTMLLTRE